MSELTNWYTVKVQNNYESIVSQRIKLEMDRINKDIKIVVPKERTVSAKKGKKVFKEKMLYPGYIFVETINIPDLQNIIRATTGATNILSTKEREPIRLRKNEVIKMLLAEEEIINPSNDDFYVIGESVKVLAGAFEGFTGTVKEINSELGKITINIAIFKKQTPVELTFEDITKI